LFRAQGQEQDNALKQENRKQGNKEKKTGTGTGQRIRAGKQEARKQGKEDRDRNRTMH
jgi:hypothetical protein